MADGDKHKGNGSPHDWRREADPYLDQRLRMVEEQIRRRDVRDPRVLDAMEEVPRHLFVPQRDRAQAYVDAPMPIGHGQTISQPYIVALMTELLELEPAHRVLEIGTGCGYQAAVLSLVAGEVFSIECVRALAEDAEKRLASLGYSNVRMKVGDGFAGWPEEAPFDGIIVTAAPDRVPQTFIDQLEDGGRLVIPVGTHFQELFRIVKRGETVKKEKITDVRFVPMVGGDH